MWREHKSASACLSLFIGLPDLKKVVVIPYARSKQETDLSKIPNRSVDRSIHVVVKPRISLDGLFSWLFFVCFHSVFLDDFLAYGCGEGDQLPQLEFEQLPFSHPLYIMYSSGTTGAPKCMVHSAGVRNTRGRQTTAVSHTHAHKQMTVTSVRRALRGRPVFTSWFSVHTLK